jgi:hypothetical protein
MARRFWGSLALSVPVIFLGMSEMLPGQPVQRRTCRWRTCTRGQAPRAPGREGAGGRMGLPSTVWKVRTIASRPVGVGTYSNFNAVTMSTLTRSGDRLVSLTPLMALDPPAG